MCVYLYTFASILAPASDPPQIMVTEDVEREKRVLAGFCVCACVLACVCLNGCDCGCSRVCSSVPPQIMVTEEVEREKRVLAGEEQRRVISLQVESSRLCLEEPLD